jgi:23S rRNA (adenine2503-C2)-methyltransferase
MHYEKSGESFKFYGNIEGYKTEQINFRLLIKIMNSALLCGMTVDEIYNIIRNYGFERTHAVKTATSFYRKRIANFSEMSDLPKSLKKLLSSDFSPGLFIPVASETSVDKTIKYLFRTDPVKEFETVYLPDSKRRTVCVSTQAGCRMGCPYCLTGRYGFKGNLTAGEIVNQIYSLPETKKITHVVFMGMGEPMDNLEDLLRACEIITSEWGFAISPRNVTVSSVGITPGIEEFLKRSNCNLTLSLFSPFAEERAEVVPVEKIYPVHRIIEIIKAFPLTKKRRISLAYVMIKDINDSDRHLNELIKLLKGSSIRINLLAYHSVPDDPNHSSSEEKMRYFRHTLISSGIPASIRKSRGEDISAACGLLASGLKKNSNTDSYYH